MQIPKSLVSGLSSLIALVSVPSCIYDSYVATGSSYSSGYGHAYGSPRFSTTHFVSTGTSRWAYDPHVNCYYDHQRRSYYDPHLTGYYPVGFRPHVVHGAPHPAGWSRGRSYCPPPRVVRSVTINNCDNRAESYRSLNQSWSQQVTQVTNHNYHTQSTMPPASAPQQPATSHFSPPPQTISQAPPTHFVPLSPQQSEPVPSSFVEPSSPPPSNENQAPVNPIENQVAPPAQPDPAPESAPAPDAPAPAPESSPSAEPAPGQELISQ